MRTILLLVADGIRYVRTHPQFLFTIFLIGVIPVAFLISGQQFLKASRENQERLEKDRVGLLHDSFLSIMQVSHADPALLQEQINKISALNPDVVAFRISKKADGGYLPIAAHDTNLIGKEERNTTFYNLAFINPSESIVQNVEYEGERFLQAVRLANIDGEEYVILTVTSRASVDALFASRIHTAYIWLTVLLVIVLVLVIRHVRLIDYGYLYREMRKANEMKDLFTNMIAHELRAPLTAMRGYASMIRENEEVNKEVREEGGRIEESAQRLILIVNDLLDVARLQSGKLSVSKEQVDLSSVIESVVREEDATATKKGIELQVEGVRNPIAIVADRKRLHQALTNLVSNAIKYTEKGAITISVEDKRDRVELRVKDTGMGIAADDQKALFAPFFRVQTNDVSKITGTGLGMWITKQLTELMGASIAVESIKGVGTHVVVTFPKR